MSHTALLIAIMAGCTVLLRFLPFLIFDHDESAPAYIVYLGKVLPQAVIGMLAVYCLRETDLSAVPYGIPEALAVFSVVLLQVWKRSSLVSILGGTVIYMILIQMF